MSRIFDARPFASKKTNPDGSSLLQCFPPGGRGSTTAQDAFVAFGKKCEKPENLEVTEEELGQGIPCSLAWGQGGGFVRG